jgi:protein archease
MTTLSFPRYREQQPGTGMAGTYPATHEFLTHTSEARLLVRAATHAELFAEAGHALGLLSLRDIPDVPAGEWREIELESADRVALLVDWLNELIFLAETERWIGIEFEVREMAARWIIARARGVSVAEPPAVVKAATMHQARISHRDGIIEAEVLFDV